MHGLRAVHAYCIHRMPFYSFKYLMKVRVMTRKLALSVLRQCQFLYPKSFPCFQQFSKPRTARGPLKLFPATGGTVFSKSAVDAQHRHSFASYIGKYLMKVRVMIENSRPKSSAGNSNLSVLLASCSANLRHLRAQATSAAIT